MTPEMMPPAQSVAPTQPQYQPAPQYQTPQPAYAQTAAPQPYPQVAQPAQPIPHHGFAAQPQVQQPHMPPSQMAQPQMHSAQYAPASQPQHHLMPAPAPQMAQPMYAHAPAAPQFSQAAMPLAPHMRVPQQAATQEIIAPVESKSFLAKLLKRSPRPEQLETDIQPPAKSGSLFNKNFALGAVVGLVVGAFVLPMILGLFGSDASVQTQAQAGPLPEFDINSPAVEDDTFLDNAMSSGEP